MSDDSSTRILVAGASGVIGRRLTPLLRAAGYQVFGMTRSADKADALRAAGATAVIADVFDAAALDSAFALARPQVVIHQLTDLPPGLDPSRMPEALVRNAQLRDAGTRRLVAAAQAAGARRLIAQSIAWMYAPGPEPHSETDPLDLASEGLRAVSLQGVIALERAVLNATALAGLVLRYGQFYGPGAAPAVQGNAPVHVDAAARAAVLAIERGAAGIYIVGEETGYLSARKARVELGWDPAFRLPG